MFHRGEGIARRKPEALGPDVTIQTRIGDAVLFEIKLLIAMKGLDVGPFETIPRAYYKGLTSVSEYLPIWESGGHSKGR